MVRGVLVRLWFVAAAMLGASHAAAQENVAQFAAKYGYLGEASRAIYEVFKKPPPPSDQDYLQVANIACDALKRLTAENQLAKDLELLQGQQGKHLRDAGLLRDNLTDFLHRFLAVERAQMLKAGVDPRLVDIAIWQAALNRKPGASPEISAARSLAAIVALRDAACAQAGAGLREADRNRQIRKIELYVAGLGAAIIIVLDAAAVPASGGLAGAVATLSVIVGTDSLNSVLQELRSDK